jgi:hypothetical protein
VSRDDRMTWTEGRTWRAERVAGRWQLSRYRPASDTWQRVSSWPTRMDAVQAAYKQDQR